MDRDVVPAVRPQHVGVLQPDRRGGDRQLDGVVAQRTHARLEVGLPVVVGRVSRELVDLRPLHGGRLHEQAFSSGTR